VVAFHQSLRETPYQANRVLALLSKIMNLAERWGERPDGSNPCRHVEKYREDKRERFLSAEELSVLGDVLAEAEKAAKLRPAVITAVRLLILTGCRLSEVLGLRWEYVDLQAQCLHLPDSKTGRKTVHLNAPALAVLNAAGRDEGNPWMIQGQRSGRPLVNLEKPWHTSATRRPFEVGPWPAVNRRRWWRGFANGLNVSPRMLSALSKPRRPESNCLPALPTSAFTICAIHSRPSPSALAKASP